jgi:hypothetical protein
VVLWQFVLLLADIPILRQASFLSHVQLLGKTFLVNLFLILSQIHHELSLKLIPSPARHVSRGSLSFILT